MVPGQFVAPWCHVEEQRTDRCAFGFFIRSPGKTYIVSGDLEYHKVAMFQECIICAMSWRRIQDRM